MVYYYSSICRLQIIYRGSINSVSKHCRFFPASSSSRFRPSQDIFKTSTSLHPPSLPTFSQASKKGTPQTRFTRQVRRRWQSYKNDRQTDRQTHCPSHLPLCHRLRLECKSSRQIGNRELSRMWEQKHMIIQ